jgi:hypothetical protein
MGHTMSFSTRLTPLTLTPSTLERLRNPEPATQAQAADEAATATPADAAAATAATPAVAADEDTFGAAPAAATLAPVAAPAVDPGKDPGPAVRLEPGAAPDDGKRIALKDGESWSQALERYFGHPVSPELVSLIVAKNQVSPFVGVKSIVVPDLAEICKAEGITTPSGIEVPSYGLVTQGETWDQVVKDYYGASLSTEDAAALAVILARWNGRSTLEGPQAVVVLPGLKDLQDGLRDLRDHVRGRAGAAGAAPRRDTSMLRDGSLANPTATPVEGKAYHPRVDDNLRGIVIATYGEHLRRSGLSADQVADWAAKYMEMLALANGIEAFDVGGIDSIYLPTTAELDAMVVQYCQSKDYQKARAAAAEQPVLRCIDSAKQGLSEAIAASTPPPPPAVGADTLDTAIGAVVDLRYQRALSSPLAQMPCFGYSLALSLEFSEPVSSRRQVKFEGSLARVDADEYVRKTCSAKTDFERQTATEAVRCFQEVWQQLEDAGEVQDGKLVFAPDPNEDVESAVARKFMTFFGIDRATAEIYIQVAKDVATPCLDADGAPTGRYEIALEDVLNKAVDVWTPPPRINDPSRKEINAPADEGLSGMRKAVARLGTPAVAAAVKPLFEIHLNFDRDPEIDRVVSHIAASPELAKVDEDGRRDFKASVRQQLNLVTLRESVEEYRDALGAKAQAVLKAFIKSDIVNGPYRKPN